MLGSQGDAGQFRTPRNIIDFIVAVIQPKKNETICDPACGTAGFLISSYKHIINANTNKTKGDLLTPQERKKLMGNFVGYDISPDMVRLSLVNLYLHNFPSPHVYEYDTLTSEDRWNEYFDIIMANPPFMTPKGGIKPHKRFSLQANRSEVLFVDYIAEHINPTTGRAGIIVPEGIIFQSATAYKSLRKMLVDNGLLYAVVSLPAGVFNPYSGVKTSILLLDKTLATKTDKILFVKITNDGFGLGAQRKELQTSDLPDAINLVLDFQNAVRNNDVLKFGNEELPLQAIAVKKDTVASSGDYNLSADRYRSSEIRHYKFDLVELGDICKIYQPKTITSNEITEAGAFKVYGANGVIGFFDKYNHEEGEVLITCRGATCGTVNFSEPKSWITGNAMVVTPIDEKIIKSFLYYLLKNTNLSSTITGAAQPQITGASLSPFKIPLPPLSVQKETVEKIKGFQQIIDGAQQVVASYIPNIEIESGWEMVNLKNIVVSMHQGINTAGDGVKFSSKGVPIIQSRNITSGLLDFEKIKFMSMDDWFKYKDKYCPRKDDLLFSNIGTIGRSIVVDDFIASKEFLIHWNIFKISPNLEIVNTYFLKFYFDKLYKEKYFEMYQKGGTVKFVSKKVLEETLIPLPPIKIQKEIVSQIESEQKLINANHKLVELFKTKIKATIDKIWEV